ncbi:MAG TPA: protease pro-enzyme activation domain-containing protein [Verrucomicrobiae bacterium]|nr:protease pro-enzyme activation domain-containing protein [Verrucomicrobiae bacterium]
MLKLNRLLTRHMNGKPLPSVKKAHGCLRISAALVLALTMILPERPARAENISRKMLPGHVPGIIGRFHLPPVSRLAGTNVLDLAIGLPLRHQAALDELLRQLYDPTSTNFHRFLTPQEFTARFGPTEQDYQAVIQFARSNGLTIAGTHPNRVVLEVEGGASNIERAFQITLRTYRHPTEARDFFAPDSEPTVPANLPVVDIQGLSDYGRPRPLLHPAQPAQVKALSGSGPNGYYVGNDFRNAYVPGCALDGTGQAVGLVEFSSYYMVDITNYEKAIGMTRYVPLNNVILSHPAPSAANNAEVALDIEMAIAMARNLLQVIVYEEGRNNQNTLLSRMANDNLAKQLSCSWTWSGGPNATTDNLFKQMAAQGQSFFQAAGDDDAYTGANTLDNASLAVAPVDSTNLTTVGGTTLTMNGSGVSWASEKVWNFASFGGSLANTGSGGGSSLYYLIPWWQTNVNMASNQGSTIYRNIPDVAMAADNIFVYYNNGSSGAFAGTSAAAPLWAGFCALVNQQSMATSGTTVGLLNPALYAIGTGSNYTACFHDITTGNNIGTNTPGLYYAVSGYDLCTGWGTPNGINLINALAPPTLPYFITQPADQTVTNGHTATFGAVVGGQSPLSFRWQFNGTNLADGGQISGAASNILAITSVTLANAGNYRLVVTNSYGAATSQVAVLTVNRILPTLTVSSSENPSGFKDFLAFTANLSPTNATGIIQFFTNGAAFDEQSLAAGTAVSANLSSLPRGTNLITAVYGGDANDLPATNTLLQIVTNHPPRAADAFYRRLAGYPLDIAVSDLATNWSDPDGDAVSLAGVSVSTNGVTLTNSAGTLFYFDANDVNDEFVCTLTDGWGGTNFQFVHVAIVTNATPNIAVVPPAVPGGITLSLGGAGGYTYVLEATTNLIPPAAWLPLATNILDTNGAWQFTDAEATNFPQRFYRLKLSP